MRACRHGCVRRSGGPRHALIGMAAPALARVGEGILGYILVARTPLDQVES